jgi:hypothetical protein
MPEEKREPKFTKAWMWDEAAKVIFRYSTLGLAGLFLLMIAPFGDQIRAVWHSPQALAALSVDVKELTQEVRRANGEDKVIRQPPGLSYVKEPVKVGEDVTMVLVIARTSLGEGCRFVGGQSLFSDARNIPFPGSEVSVQRQVGNSDARLYISITPPEELLIGRVEMWLILEYQCNGGTHFEPTYTVTYELKPN